MGKKKVIAIILSGVAAGLLMVLLAGRVLSQHNTENQNNTISEIPAAAVTNQSFSGSDNTESTTDRASAAHISGQAGTLSGGNETGNLQKAVKAEDSALQNSTTIPVSEQNKQGTMNKSISGYAGNETGNKPASPAPGVRNPSDSAAGTPEESVRRVGGLAPGNNGSSGGTGELFEGEEKLILPSEEITVKNEMITGSDRKKSSDLRTIDSAASDSRGNTGSGAGSDSNPGTEKQTNRSFEIKDEKNPSGEEETESDRTETTDQGDQSRQNEINRDQNPEPENDQSRQNQQDDDAEPRQGIELPVLLF